jgi:uroporphyrinogen decarboxylase
MNRTWYNDLAASGLRMPIGADLVFREKPDAEEIVLDGRRLGAVIEEAARRFRTPLAVPLMDLTIEKACFLEILGLPSEEVANYHFREPPGPEAAERAAASDRFPTPRLRASIEAVAHIARETDLVPVGMTIGPFSLTTKLIADPISPVYLAGKGASAAEDEEVRLFEELLEAATRVILRSVEAQLKAGARMVIIAEPAANSVFFSPRQIEAGSDIFERYAMAPNRRIRELLRPHGADLFYHSCGEVTEGMVKAFAALDPAILSLGSSRKLWEDAAIVPSSTVLFGNLPTKKFLLEEMPLEEVVKIAGELRERMAAIGRHFILGSECDVLSVPGYHDVILAKVNAAFLEPLGR